MEFTNSAVLYAKFNRMDNLCTDELTRNFLQKKDLPSSEQYYLGGFYSVRGYKEKVVEGNDGFNFSLEYSLPLNSKKNLSAFVFFDGGKIINSPEYMTENPFLLSTGLGLRYSPIKNISTNITLGFPLKRHVNGQDVNKSRINVSFSGSF